jgi:hypothetical protein
MHQLTSLLTGMGTQQLKQEEFLRKQEVGIEKAYFGRILLEDLFFSSLENSFVANLRRVVPV